MPGYTPRFLAAVRRRYEDTDEPMPQIASLYDISLRTLHRMVEREGWRKRGDRPPRDLNASMLSLERAEDLRRQVEAMARAHHERLRRERVQALQQAGSPHGAQRNTGPR